jgi:hypothetical protein
MLKCAGTYTLFILIAARDFLLYIRKKCWISAIGAVFGSNKAGENHWDFTDSAETALYNGQQVSPTFALIQREGKPWYYNRVLPGSYSHPLYYLPAYLLAMNSRSFTTLVPLKRVINR